MTHRRVVAYVRLSKSLDDDQLTTQRQDVQQLADRRGLKLAHIYEDNDISAAELHGRAAKARPGFNELMAAVARNEISHVLVRDTGRLFRGRRQRVTVYESFAEHRVDLWCVRGPDLDLSSPSGRLVANVLGEVAAWEVEELSVRTGRVLRRRWEDGLPPTAGRTFGYTEDGMELVTEEAAAVRDVFAYVMSGGSLSGAARMLNGTGLLTRGGKQHTAGTTRHMLRNLRYAAVREDADGKVWPGVWPRVVDEDSVRACRALLSDPARRSSSSNASRWALSSIGDCGVCGGKVTSGSRGKAKSGEPVPIYRCPSCRKLGRLSSPVDAYLRNVVAAVVERDAEELMAPRGESPEVQDAREAVTAGRLRLEQLADLVGTGELDPVAYAGAVKAVNARVSAAQGTLDRFHQDDALAGVADAEDVSAAVHALPLDRFRHVLGLLFESITLLPTKHLPKTLGFLPESVAITLRSGRPVPLAGPLTLTVGVAVARDLADALRSGGFAVQVRGGSVTLPADAADVAREVQTDLVAYGLTYPLDPRSAVVAAVQRIADASTLTDEQKEAVRAVLSA